MQKATAINLARGRGETFVDKFTVWALTAGRIVIILTETIALAAFLYRFSLDAKILKLHDTINQEQSVVNALSQNEVKYRSLQNTLNSIDTLNAQAGQNVNILTGIYAFAGPTITIQNFTLTPGSLQIQLTTDNINTLYTFVNQIKNFSPVTQVNVDKVENKTSSGKLIAALSITLKNN